MEAFDDPDVKNVTCYVSRAKTGGLRGIGPGIRYLRLSGHFLSSKSGRSNCRIVLKTAKLRARSIEKRTSLVFKSLQVVRFYDAKRNVLAYLAYSRKLMFAGNAISPGFPVMPWRQ
ncbi:CreA family protein [Escherichia coli]